MRHRLKKTSLAFLVALVFVMILGGTISRYSYANYFRLAAESQKSDYQIYENLILSDFELIREKKLFLKTSKKNNAVSLIKQQMIFNNKKIINSEDTELSQISNDYFETYGFWVKGKISDEQLLKHPAYKKISYSWINDFNNFDHLNIFEDSLFNDISYFVPRLDGIDRANYRESLPDLDWKQLQTHILLYISHKVLIEKNIELALLNLRHLSTIMQSNPSMGSQLFAVGLLRHEVLLTEKFGLKSKDYLTHSDIDRLKRLAFAWKDLITLVDHNDYPESLKPYFTSQFMMCGGISMNRGHIFYSDLLEDTWPFEDNLSEQIKMTRKLFSKLYIECGLDNFEPFLHSRDRSLKLADDPSKTYPSINGPFSETSTHFWIKLPYLKKAIGSQLRGFTSTEKMVLYAVEYKKGSNQTDLSHSIKSCTGCPEAPADK